MLRSKRKVTSPRRQASLSVKKARASTNERMSLREKLLSLSEGLYNSFKKRMSEFHMINLSFHEYELGIRKLNENEADYILGPNEICFRDISERYCCHINSQSRDWVIRSLEERVDTVILNTPYRASTGFQISEEIDAVVPTIWSSIKHICCLKMEQFDKIGQFILSLCSSRIPSLLFPISGRLIVSFVQYAVDFDCLEVPWIFQSIISHLTQSTIADINGLLMSSKKADSDSMIASLVSLRESASCLSGIRDTSQRCLFVFLLKNIDSMLKSVQISAKCLLIAVSSISEAQAAKFLLLMGLHENPAQYLAKLLFCIGPLSWDPNSVESVRVLEPLQSEGSNEDLSRINYPVEFGLRGDSIKGQAIDDLLAFPRLIPFEQVIAGFSEARDLVFEVCGCPGTGKSITVARYAQRAAIGGKLVLWISSDQCKSMFKVVMMYNNIVVATEVALKYIDDFINKENLFHITVIDGVTDSDMNLAASVSSWARRTKRTAIIVRSEGMQGLKGTIKINSYRWEWDEYKKAMLDKKFWESIKKIFVSDPDLDSSVTLKSALSLPNDEPDREELIADAVEAVLQEKFFIAGGNARFMFALYVSDVKRVLDQSLRDLKTNFHISRTIPGQMRVINTIFASAVNDVMDFVSLYTIKQFKKICLGENLRNCWQVAKSLNNCGRGTIFQYAFETCIKDADEGVQVTRFTVGASIKENWTANSYKYYQGLVFANISSSLQRAIQQGKVLKDRQYFVCEECSSRKLTLINLDKHINEKHPEMFDELNNIPENINSYFAEVSKLVNGNLNPLENLDLEDNLWLIPDKDNEKVIDYIWLKDESEAFLVQVTVSHKHSILDYGYLTRIRDILRQKCPQLTAKFVVLVPSNVKFIFTKEQKDQLNHIGIPWSWARIEDGVLKDFEAQ